MNIYPGMTDIILIDRLNADPKYLIDRDDVVELIRRFEIQKAKLYEAEQIIDEEGFYD